eukprot:COSAG01_NODE_3427_length_6093_cov_9.704943_4_plen_339_part_00
MSPINFLASIVLACMAGFTRALFTVTSGAQFCQLNAQGCVTDGAGSYGHNEHCAIQVANATTVTATWYAVESNYDYLTVNGQDYHTSGSGPSNVLVPANGVITWQSDGSVAAGSHGGFVLCEVPPPPPEPAPQPEPEPPPPPSVFTVTSGAQFCQLNAQGCVTDGAGSYGHNEHCTIQVANATTVTATWYAVESNYDYLTVNGQDYHTSGSGPSNVLVPANGVITWQSDGSVAAGSYGGFVLCDNAFLPPPPLVPPTLAGTYLVPARGEKLVELCALNSHSPHFQNGCPLETMALWTASGDPAITSLCVRWSPSRAVPCVVRTDESACVRGGMDGAGI